MSDTLCVIEFDGLDLIKHDEFRGGKREVIFVDLNVGIGEGNALVFVENLICHWNFYKILLIKSQI